MKSVVPASTRPTEPTTTSSPTDNEKQALAFMKQRMHRIQKRPFSTATSSSSKSFTPTPYRTKGRSPILERCHLYVCNNLHCFSFSFRLRRLILFFWLGFGISCFIFSNFSTMHILTTETVVLNDTNNANKSIVGTRYHSHTIKTNKSIPNDNSNNSTSYGRIQESPIFSTIYNNNTISSNIPCRYNGNCPSGETCNFDLKLCKSYLGSTVWSILPQKELKKRQIIVQEKDELELQQYHHRCVSACMEELTWEERYYYGAIPIQEETYHGRNGHGCVIAFHRKQLSTKEKEDNPPQISHGAWIEHRFQRVVRVDKLFPHDADFDIWHAVCNVPCESNSKDKCPQNQTCTRNYFNGNPNPFQYNDTRKTCRHRHHHRVTSLQSHDMTIITGADTFYFHALKNFVASAKYWASNYSVVVYNLGMTKSELHQVQQWSNVIDVQWINGSKHFNLSFPSYDDEKRDSLETKNTVLAQDQYDHVDNNNSNDDDDQYEDMHNEEHDNFEYYNDEMDYLDEQQFSSLHTYAWKSIIIYEAVQKYKSILWLDAGITLTAPIQPLEDILHQQGLVLVRGQDDDMKYKSHPLTYQRLGYNKFWFPSNRPHFAGGIQGHVYPSRYSNSIVVKNYDCAMAGQDCIAPLNSTLSTHRFDQTVLSILAYAPTVQAPHYTEYLAAFREQLQTNLSQSSVSKIIWTSRGACSYYSNEIPL